MPTRNVVLTKHQEKIIKTLVRSGRYQNASEVVREGLRLKHVPAKWNPVRRQGHASTVESTAFPVDMGSPSDPISTENAVVEQREAEDTAKLEVLREAADVGFGALDRGEFKEFDTIDDLQRYLTGLST
jgi:antitoxin ParD1/3/4